jgi:ABC-type nitrate/sulfonate/bicarbonate transport system substrate-binding protein
MRFAYNEYAYQWSFPEIVAARFNLFEQAGLDLDVSSFVPEKGVRKNTAYTSLLKSGRSDLYHAGEWACIIRVSQDPTSCIVAASTPGFKTLNSTFSIYVRKDSGIDRPEHLADRKIAVEEDTGSYFTAMQDLRRFLHKSQIRLVQVGSPHLRFLSLFRGEVDAASLIHPWTDLAKEMGFVELVRTDRKNPTLAVSNRELQLYELRSFFHAVNQAIKMINQPTDEVRTLYSQLFLKVCSELPAEIRAAADVISNDIEPPKWEFWQSYRIEQFESAISLLRDFSFELPNVSFGNLIHPRIKDIFS